MNYLQVIEFQYFKHLQLISTSIFEQLQLEFLYRISNSKTVPT